MNLQQKESGSADRKAVEARPSLSSLFRAGKRFSLTASLLFFLLLVFFSTTTLPGASYVDLTLQTDREERIQLFCSNGLKKFHEKFSASSRPLDKDKITDVRLRSGNMPVNRVRLDTGESPGTLKIYKIVAHSRFAKSAVLDPSDIYQLFSRHSPGAIVRLRSNFVEVISTDADSYLISDSPLLHGGFFLLYGLPMLAAGLLFLVLEQADVTRFPAFADILAKHPSAGDNIDALDGLRGIAAIMVVADHTWGRFTGLGAGGVWLFMSLSGFLLARPFVLQPERAGSAQYWARFFRRRIQRILPVYYVYIVIIYLFHFRFDAAVRHFLFLQGDGHLWAVPQEMFFYMLVPVIMAVNAFLLRGRPWFIALHLTALILLANRFLNTDLFSLYGMRNQPIRPFLGVFLAGCTASYLYYGVYCQYESKFSSEQRTKAERIFTVCAAGLLLFFLLCSTERPWGGQRVFAQRYFEWFGVAAAGLLFSILAGKKGRLNRLLSWVPLRAVSVVSFSLYIFHPLLINCIRNGVKYYSGGSISGFPLFAATLVVSYAAACWTYTYIERPFIRLTPMRK